jgi:DMSO/TMAO reductase YedYZ molybdopterin-dependent catalytic subunit
MAEAVPSAMALGATPLPTDGPLTLEELQLATRNRGMPLEALRYDITPVGLHYLLVHFDIPMIDAASWRLAVDGGFERPLSLALADLQAMPRVTTAVTLECAGNGRARLHPRPISQPWLYEAIGTAEWTGTPLAGVLAAAGLAKDAVEVVFTGADHGVEKGNEHDYARSLAIADAMRPEVLLAYEMNGRPLEPQHGFPLRLLVPGWYGMTQVKWLTRIEAVARHFTGYQQTVAYHYRRHRDDPGTPVQRMRPRALLIPPGFPDFLTRRRVADAGTHTIEGRAWSGSEGVAKVEFAADGVWREARLGPAAGRFAWRRWSIEWPAEAGEHVLSCRATDTNGEAQPTEEPWNLQGMGNNLVQTVPVTVR